jgi:hypothetical protein
MTKKMHEYEPLKFIWQLELVKKIFSGAALPEKFKFTGKPLVKVMATRG